MSINFLSKGARMKATTIFSVALLGSLSGCTNLQNDSQRTRTEGALTGAAAGAAIGAGTGALVGQNEQGAMAGAAAGALAGGLAGAAVGDSVAKKKEGYAGQESALNAQLAGLNRQIEARQKYNAVIRQFVAEKERQLATVLASDRSAGPTAQEFDLRTSVNAEVGKVDRATRSWQETIEAHKAVLKGASADARGPELEAEINRLAAERSELLRQRAQLISINEKLNK